MKENFDCTQFISFDYDGANNVETIIRNVFRDSVFEVINCNEIILIKKEYFKYHLAKYFFELKYDDFMGEFEDWKYLDKPTLMIQQFIDRIGELYALFQIKRLVVILTNFAEKGETKDLHINITKWNINKGMFSMSSHNYEVWADNLILEIID
jgi:hypothetical protein